MSNSLPVSFDCDGLYVWPCVSWQVEVEHAFDAAHFGNSENHIDSKKCIRLDAHQIRTSSIYLKRQVLLRGSSAELYRHSVGAKAEKLYQLQLYALRVTSGTYTSHVPSFTICNGRITPPVAFDFWLPSLDASKGAVRLGIDLRYEAARKNGQEMDERSGFLRNQDAASRQNGQEKEEDEEVVEWRGSAFKMRGTDVARPSNTMADMASNSLLAAQTALQAASIAVPAAGLCGNLLQSLQTSCDQMILNRERSKVLVRKATALQQTLENLSPRMIGTEYQSNADEVVAYVPFQLERIE